jgi:hypothetical protein
MSLLIRLLVAVSSFSLSIVIGRYLINESIDAIGYRSDGVCDALFYCGFFIVVIGVGFAGWLVLAPYVLFSCPG